MSNVKLAIRVRPFTEKEVKSEKNHSPVVSILDEKTVTITNIKVSLSGAGDSRERLRRYQADYVFDSMSSSSPSYASQEKVFQTIGQPVLDTISSGISACVLAYGQSATGKTYTMMGTEASPGLIPRLCLAFAETEPLDLTVSFFEIYNERVHDLLASEVLPCNSLPRRTGNTRKDLRVREHPTKGPYVQNLRRVSVHDVESLLSIVSEGKRQRRSAATKRNCNSSRSHALLEISTPHATLRLVDLAGSEKAGQEGNGGCRQKEGSNINKSLVALSNVISALVRDGGRGRFVPYRNSALTLLLRDCLSGDSSTFIIATISPSISCLSETASTLRWVARARYLPVKNPHNKDNLTTKSALQAQYNQLLLELTKHYIRYVPATGKILFEDKHWDLNVEKICKKENIGNIMNFSLAKVTNNLDSVPTMGDEGSNLVTKVDKQDIAKEINNEIDNLLGVPLARSGTDIDIVMPTRNQRQYRSQEVLSPEKIEQLQLNKDILSDPSLSEHRLDKTKSDNINLKSPVSILYDKNQRAEIVASVTERLYSKLKNNEISDQKPEGTLDKKNSHPMNELKICTNARQRLMEISQKAIRNKRRIGIPAYTQTRKNIIRMRDQCIDAQRDLLSYQHFELNNIKHLCYRDVSTETKSLTPRYKEVATGSDYGNLSTNDNFTTTEFNRKVYKETGTMATICSKERCTQTLNVLKPPKKKRRSIISKYLKHFERKSINNTPSIININITPLYNQEIEPEYSGDGNNQNIQCNIMAPDLLKNHGIESLQTKTNPINQDQSSDEDSSSCDVQVEALEAVVTDDGTDSSEMFMLPKPLIYNTGTETHEKQETKILSSSTEEEHDNHSMNCSDIEDDLRSKLYLNQSFRSLDTDESNNSTKTEDWCCKRSNSLRRSNTNQRTKFKTAKSKLYKEFLGMKKENDSAEESSSYSSFYCPSSNNINNNMIPRKPIKFEKIEKTYDRRDSFKNVERKIENSCKKLESATNNYENYLDNYTRNVKPVLRTPTEYLQHLIEIRKELVKDD
ncbi:kinesin-like protein KIF16B [Pieris napi]|uniref:kinesin-like protein KIF16B n=1 Tax=Pieris napi TaxID=78633 RepID=UPI001FBB9C9F|nr:kinesin-like protein KIF16B [Pieris napi]